MRFEVLPLDYSQIDAAGRPQLPNQPECLPAVLYDTLNLPLAGPAGGFLKFFQQQIPDLSLTNVQGGQLPSGYRFRIQSFLCDFLREPTGSAVMTTAGVLTDIARILKTNRAFFTFKINQKDYYPIPLTFAHASGGETGFLAASFTAPFSIQYGNNGVFDDGFQTDGALWILDKQPFEVRFDFAPVFTALAVDTLTRFSMRGTLYRPVQ